MNAVDSTTVGVLFGLLAAGLVSGLLPFVNAEAILTVAVLGADQSWLALAICIAVGQAVAKTIIFVGSREGVDRIRGRPRAERRVGHVRVRALSRVTAARVQQMLSTLERPLAGTALVGVSAVVGLPPLAATSVLAGAAHMRMALFCSTCLIGRLIRFGLVAYPLARISQS